MINITIKKLKDVLVTYDIELVEVMSGFAALTWGLWLLNPIADTFVSSRTFSTMALIAPEELWGIAMVIVGFLQVYSVVVHKLNLRKQSSIVLSIMWLFITAVFAHANHVNTAVAIYGVFTAFTTWSYLRLSQRVEIKSKFNRD